LGATLERVRDEVQRLAAEGLDEEPFAVEPVRPLGYSGELTEVLGAAQRIAHEAQAQAVELSHLSRALAER
jgi:hypothetical protein